MMGKRGPIPKKIVNIEWTPNLVYTIGLITSDGNLSPDGRHLSFKVTDLELIYHFVESLRLHHIKISKIKIKGKKIAYRVQFGDVNFYKFLLSIGLMPNKSKKITEVKVPDNLYFDFLRGVFDGDGSSNSYWDKRWRSSFLIYLNFVSGSLDFLKWLKKTNNRLVGIKGHVSSNKEKNFHQLKYAKNEAIELFKKMYYNPKVLCLKRKKLKLQKAFNVNTKQQCKYKLARVLE